MYKEKYIKYKTKYLDLKNQIGGMIYKSESTQLKSYLNTTRPPI